MVIFKTFKLCNFSLIFIYESTVSFNNLSFELYGFLFLCLCAVMTRIETYIFCETVFFYYLTIVCEHTYGVNLACFKLNAHVVLC